MEIKLSGRKSRRAHKRARSIRSGLLITLVAAVATAVTFGITIQQHWPYFSTSVVWPWFSDRGHNALREDVRVRKTIPTTLKRMLAAQFFQPTFPKIVVDIKFKHMQKLQRKRQEALARELLVQGSDDFVPASIRYLNRTIKVRLRLKGDLIDHLQGNKWSLRVNVRGTDHLFGMRRFSIQHPRTRGFHGELLYFETLRHVGVLAPRYQFVNVTVNGDHIGLMALEEHFSKELLESNRRREGPILRFDEFYVWQASDGKHGGFEGVFDDYQNAQIDAFRSSKIAKSEQLSKNYRTAVGLLRGFVDGYLTASETFDSELMGRYLAVARLWGADHGVIWHNQRFYFNPVTARLEPIGYDVSTQYRIGIGENFDEPLIDACLDDPRIFNAYQRTLRDLERDILEGQFVDVLEKIEEKHLPSLRDEFYSLSGFEFDDLRERAKALRAMNAAELRQTSRAGDSYPTLIHAYLVKDDNGQFLEVINAVPNDVVIQSASWVMQDDEAGIIFEPLSDQRFPLHLVARAQQSRPETLRIPYRSPDQSTALSLQMVTNIHNDTRQRVVVAKAYHPSLSKNPIPVSTADDQLARHPFLKLDIEQRAFTIRAGTWQLRESLIVPPGFSLSMQAGTTLRFFPKQALIAHGAVNLKGTREAPVVLEGIPADDNDTGVWQGLVVLDAEDRSKWSHVEIRDTSGIDLNDWQLTGGVTFYQSDINIEHARFRGNRGEDAINVIRSNFNFTDVQIVDTVSDAFDFDFSRGEVKGGLISDIGKGGGGDAIDISGSKIEVIGTRLVNISDKALSVGERSEMTTRNISIEKAGIGAASKDSSILRIENSSIRHSHHADLMAYIKKPEYGHASIEAKGLTFAGALPRARAQKGSTITLDGVPVENEDIDVQQLYDSIMRKGLPQ